MEKGETEVVKLPGLFARPFVRLLVIPVSDLLSGTSICRDAGAVSYNYLLEGASWLLRTALRPTVPVPRANSGTGRGIGK